ncbi:unnamed protein product [Brachionus calyciflorus]|uniref:DUF659 domain-containing protein n=1 Tax=Brachionus calyciflorus TaxID=104777 RepID=A0A814F042_9BILA|nr:unnamed protein product [Brachionus calyciflorus]
MSKCTPQKRLAQFNNKELSIKKQKLFCFGSANIPLHKLHSKFFKNIFTNYLKPEYKIPGVRCCNVALMCDEILDSMNRSVFQKILIKLDFNADIRPKLVQTIFLEDVNYETVTRSIIECLIEMEIKFQNVMVFISDNASYMLKAFKSLKTILFNCTHVACFAHIIALVGETWRSNLSEVDLIFANLKSIFARGSNHKKRFIDFLKSNEEKIQRIIHHQLLLGGTHVSKQLAIVQKI